jgi:YVTN family beta-propeller protein
MMATRRGIAVSALLVLSGAAVWGAKAWRDGRIVLGKQTDGGYVVPTNQTVTPIGTVKAMDGERPKDLAVSDDGKTLAVLTTGGVRFYDRDGADLGKVPLNASAMGLTWGRGELLFASQEGGTVAVIQKQAGKWALGQSLTVDVPARTPEAQKAQPKNPQPTGLAVSPEGTRLYVALGIRNAVAVYDLAETKILKTIPVGIAPYKILLNADGTALYVANRGGTVPNRAGKDTAPSAGTPTKTAETDGVVNGTVSIVDLESGKERQIGVGKNPSGMTLSPDGKFLYVANSDSDTVSVLDAERGRITQTINLRPPNDPKFGQMPTDCTLSPNGKTLYVACGGANAVAVVDLSENPTVRGWFPAAWFPIAIRQNDGTLLIASAKGLGSEPERKAGRYGVHDIIGAVQWVKPNEIVTLDAHTAQVAKNNRWGQELPARPNIAPVPIPERIGEPSVFKRVVYIIKENLTYDSVLGDMEKGNSDPKLCLFPEPVSPNHHALARQFVLLDNTYTSGTNSADGHQWSAAALANAYMEQNYSAHVRSYPYDGGDPLAYSPEGFLWQAAQKAGRTVKVYGEFVNKPTVRDKTTGKMPTWTQLWEERKNKTRQFEILADTDNAHLKPLLHPNYVGWPTEVSDQYRADLFLADLAEWEQKGKMPDLSILLLPCDHTNGTDPGFPSPKASVADNDLALGRIVEGIAKSKFWRDTLILVIQDDSQLGVDHVSGHRTAAFCISPYTKRGAVVSEPYNHTSLFRTMELVLGIPAMNRFDRSATPMTACFTPTPDLTPYTVMLNQHPLDEINPKPTALRGEARKWAEASAKLDFSSMDRANALVLARAVWHKCKPNTPFPTEHFHAVVDEDDAEEE